MRVFQLLGSSMLLLAGVAQAQAQAQGTVGGTVSGTIAATSDYDFRGVSQTLEDPALQASLGWEGATGWYAGLWGSNVDFDSDSDVEVDACFGYAGETDGGLIWDVGLNYYSYWPDGDDINYPEAYVGFGFQALEIKLWYTHDYVNLGDSALYLEGNLNFELPRGFGLALHAGHSSGDGIDEGFGDSYIDYSIGVTRAFGDFEFAVKYVDTDIDDPDFGDGRVVFSVSTSVPWGT